MRKIILATMAATALFSASAVAEPASLFNWSGFYWGANGGYGSGNQKLEFASAGTELTGREKGGLWGGQAGFNIQSGNFVYGLEIMYDGADIDYRKPCPNAALNCTSKVGSLGSATGRLGYAFGPSLLYAKGGWGLSRITFGASNGESTSEWRNGGTVGGGWEYAVTNNVTFRLEYNYYQFQTANSTTGVELLNFPSAHLETVTAGINFKY
jgi:outer membrane immunogenic protein